MDVSHEKIVKEFEILEAATEKVISSQEKCKLYEMNRRKSQEAINRLNDSNAPSNVWACLSHQFFKVPKNPLKTALRSDIQTLAGEIDILRTQIKRDLEDLRQLEGKESLKGFNLKPLSQDELFADPVIPSAPQDKSHRRYNPLTQEWVVVSPNRISRPWTGAVEKTASSSAGTSDPSSFQKSTPKSTALAPGAIRSTGAVNPFYESTYTFPNDFPAFSARVESEEAHDLSEEAKKAKSTDTLFAWAPATGECYVTCFHPRPDLTLALMDQDDIVKVIEEWTRLTHQCAERGFQWIQIFENRGEIMGCSNPHPHCQVWASDFIPTRALRSDHGQQDYFSQQKRPLLLDYVTRELAAKERIIVSNSDWVVLVPWWAFWPFESMILPRKRHVGRLDELSPEERSSLADVMSQILIAYDNLFETSFPYSFGWYQTPLQRPEKAVYWQLHGLYLPPLLRSANLKKHMVGYELLAELQRDLTQEKAADLLRQAAAKKHYLKRSY
nr:galactose 1 phosphate uridylyltransferase [Hymenolepis microstoma]